MSINDFEYLPEPEDALSIQLGSTIRKRNEAHDAIDALADAAGEKWFELGTKLERKRVIDLLDKLDQGLLDSEEDAKITIGVLRKMVENDTSIEGDSEESYSG